MRSRIAAAAVMLVLLSACSLRLGEETKTDGALELGSRDTACLTGSTATIVDYFDGKATDERISGVWDCASRSLKLFAERTRGKTAGLYSPRELRNFLEYYFLNKDGRRKESVITDRMLAELMELKQTLLGGSRDSLRQEELVEAREIMNIFREQSIKLRPFLPLSFAKYDSADEATLNAAVTAMEEAAGAVARVLRGAGHDYLFSNLSTFLHELELAAGDADTAEAIRGVRAYVPLVQQLKATLIAPDSSRIASDEWHLLLTQAVRSYGLMLRFSNAQHQHSSWVHLDGREKLVSISHSALALLDGALARRPEETIDFSEFDALLDVVPLSFFTVVTPKGPRQISREHAKQLLRVFVQRGLGGPRSGPLGRDATGLTRAAVKRAGDLLVEWSEGQRYIDLLWARIVGTRIRVLNVSGVARRSQLTQPTIEEVFGAARDQIPESTWNAAARLKDQFGRREPLFRGDDSELTFAGWAKDPEFSYGALTRLNTFSVLGRLLLASYAEDFARAEVGVTKAEVERFYWDFRDVGIDLRIFDPVSTHTAAKRFLESDLFTFDANGDDLMSAEEAAGIVAYMISSKSLANRVHDQIAAVCNQPQHEAGQEVPVDFFGFETVSADCYRREFFSGFSAHMARFPLLVAYYESLSADKRQEFEVNLEAAARSKGIHPTMESPDSEGFSGISHYVESMFQRFDRNRNGTISKKEAIDGRGSVLSVFKSALKVATCKAGSCLKEDSQLEAVLTYMLAEGHTPSKLQYFWWVIKRPFWSFEADRSRVLEILGNLSKVLNAQPAKKIPESPSGEWSWSVFE